MLELSSAVNVAALKQAISQLLVQHDALRLRFVREGNNWRQFNVDYEENTSFSLVELDGRLTKAEQRRAIQLAQSSLNLSDGPLVRAIYFKEARHLLLIIHHLAIDAVSWRILLEDLNSAYRQAIQGQEITFAPKTTSFKQWAERMQAYAASESARLEAEYWLSDRWFKAEPLPLDFELSSNSEASANTVRIDFDSETTRTLVHEAPQAFRTGITEILLAALGRALWRSYGAEFVTVDLEAHGREPVFEGVDVSRTVGWFTTIYPVLLETTGAYGDEIEALKNVKEQVRNIPHHGLGYSALRHLNSESEVARLLAARSSAEVLFNYLGRLDRALPDDAFFEISTETVDRVRSPRARRSHLIEINSYVADGRLRVEWTYSENVQIGRAHV